MLPSTPVTHGGRGESRTPETGAYKAPATYPTSSYTSTKSGGCGQIRTDYLALMRRLLIRMSFAAIGEGGRTRTSGSGFGDRQCSHFAYTLIFKEQ